MALNLWKNGGKPTSYTKLSSGESLLIGIGEYTMTIRAKSPSGSTLRPYKATDLTSVSYVLTSDYKTYTFSFKSTKSDNLQLLVTGNNDVDVAFIELVEKPLPKFTINGIDGFGKWSDNIWTWDNYFLPLPANGKTYVLPATKTRYKLTCAARSKSNAVLQISSWTTTNDLHQDIQLSPAWKEIELEWNEDADGYLYLTDKAKVGDIEITGIVLKRLDTKWTLHANAKVIDDETLELNATANFQTNQLNVPVKAGDTITCSCGMNNSINDNSATGAYFQAVFKNDSLADVGGYTVFYNGSKTLVVPQGATKLNISLSNNAGAGKYTFKRPMLNLGTIPAPYEPKRGERMVMPVARKNLFPPSFGFANWGSFYTVNEVLSDGSFKITNNDYSTPRSTSPNLPKEWGGKEVTFSVDVVGFTGNGYRLSVYDNKAKAYIGNKTNITRIGKASITTTLPLDCSEVQFWIHPSHVADRSSVSVKNLQAEFGTTATEFEPYAVQINPKPKKAVPKARTGLVMLGDAYVQLPSMTIDAIEIECLIETNQSGWKTIFDNRPNADKFFEMNNSVPTLKGFNYSGFKLGERTKLKLESTTGAFASSPFVFKQYSVSTQNVKGTLYKVTCYLAGKVVAEYDFENPANIVGDKVIPNAKNLIPSFEDSRWQLHANAKVLGKDVLRLDATAGTQRNTFTIDTKPNTNYLFKVRKFGNGDTAFVVRWLDANGGVIESPYNYTVNDYSVVLLSKSNAKQAKIELGNVGTLGAFEFTRPEMYELSGNEGTIYGKPIPQRKQAKRLLYAKR